MMAKLAKVPRLKDEGDGEGTVVFPPDWKSEDPLVRTDLLGDWVAMLDRAYEESQLDFHVSLQKYRPRAERQSRRAIKKALRTPAPHTAETFLVTHKADLIRFGYIKE